MSDEISLSGEKAFRLLEAQSFPSDNKFGAVFYDKEGTGITIIGFKGGYILTGQKKYSNTVFLKNTELELVFPTPNQELQDIVDSTKSNFDILLEAAENRKEAVHNKLATMGYPLDLCKASLEEKEFIIGVLTRKSSPSKYDRTKIFDVAKDPQVDLKIMRWYVSFFSKWLQDIEWKNFPEPEGRMHLAYLYRHTADYLRVLKVTNVTEFGQQRFPCASGMLAVLCTIRAATLLDVYELHWDPELLKIARKTIGKAWAMTKSEHASLVYKRLEKFERELESQEYVKKVNEAYKDWASYI